MDNKCLFYLSSVGHTTPLHTLKLLAQAAFLNLANDSLLRVLKVALVAKFHQVTRLVHFALKATKSALNGFTIANFDFDLDKESRVANTLHCKLIIVVTSSEIIE
jgi:hypothetical protein